MHGIYIVRMLTVLCAYHNRAVLYCRVRLCDKGIQTTIDLRLRPLSDIMFVRHYALLEPMMSSECFIITMSYLCTCSIFVKAVALHAMTLVPRVCTLAL